MASSQGDVRPSPMAYPAVRSLPKLPLPLRPETRSTVPLSRTTCSASRSPSSIPRHRPPSPATKRSSDLNRYSPDIHSFTSLYLPLPLLHCTSANSTPIRLARSADTARVQVDRCLPPHHTRALSAGWQPNGAHAFWKTHVAICERCAGFEAGLRADCMRCHRQ